MPQRDTIAQMEAAADAPAMPALHAGHIRAVNERSAQVAWAVEQAAADATAAGVWRTMNENRCFGIRGTHRTLTTHAGLTPDGLQQWLGGYYRRVFLLPHGA